MAMQSRIRVLETTAAASIRVSTRITIQCVSAMTDMNLTPTRGHVGVSSKFHILYICLPRGPKSNHYIRPKFSLSSAVVTTMTRLRVDAESPSNQQSNHHSNRSDRIVILTLPYCM